MQAMDISRTGLDVEWRRLELIAQNIANADVAGPTKGAVYRQQNLVTGPKTDFASLIEQAGTNGSGMELSSLKGVAELAVEASATPPRRVHEPGNPAADDKGFVSYPSIDHAEQMTLMVKTTRAYEANLVAMNAAREMYSKALGLGRTS
jgi:flagellar basal-body rod protein FlgC